MNELEVVDNVRIEDMIYEIRGKQVMLDSDLGFLYKCKNGTKTINQSVTRNKDKFPDDFCFQLTMEEYNNILKSQLGTSSVKNMVELENCLLFLQKREWLCLQLQYTLVLQMKWVSE